MEDWKLARIAQPRKQSVAYMQAGRSPTGRVLTAVCEGTTGILCLPSSTFFSQYS